MYYSQNNSIIAQNTTFGYNYGYNCSCHVRPSDFIMPSACISSRSLRTRRLFWSSVLPVGSASLRNLKIASNFMPSFPAFLTTCCAIIFNLSRSRPLSLVYSDTCIVFLAMSSEIVYEPNCTYECKLQLLSGINPNVGRFVNVLTQLQELRHTDNGKIIFIQLCTIFWPRVLFCTVVSLMGLYLCVLHN